MTEEGVADDGGDQYEEARADEPPADLSDPSHDAVSDRADEIHADLPDGAGCTEIWEHLSAHRGDSTE